ncbi:MAG: PIG-L family deacetylase [Candidatus Hydrogenedentota bacterium]
MPTPTALAVAAHPDDIEFMMAGTLLLLGQAGYELHVFNIANGSCGTASTPRAAIVEQRGKEAKNAARVLGAHHHEPLVDDLDIFYTKPLIKGVAAVVRAVKPAIMLVHSPEDYMEDHMNACRLAVTAGFVRGMCNYPTQPEQPPVDTPLTIYHAQPHAHMDGLRRSVRPGMYVDIGSVLEQKRAALACHVSQKQWLDESQGMDSYLHTMEDLCREAGRWSALFEYAEGWRRHSHMGFCGPDDDPLHDALGEKAAIDPGYEAALREARGE